ncbi:MAG: hypothetical protein AAFN65_06375 [Bacteroidota bacterium]
MNLKPPGLGILHVQKLDYPGQYKACKKEMVAFYKYHGIGSYNNRQVDIDDLNQELIHRTAKATGVSKDQVSRDNVYRSLAEQNKFEDRIIHEDEFLEEVICDDLAYQFLLDHDCYTEFEIIKSCKKALNCLLVLGAFDSMSELKDEYSLTNDYFHRASLREHVFSSLKIVQKDYDQEFADKIEQITAKLDDRINDIILFKLPVIFDQNFSSNEEMKERPILDHNTRMTINRLLKSLR